MMEPIKGVIFDYGGTIDSNGDHWSHVIDAAYRAEGVELPREAFRDAYVHAERELARTRHILPDHDFYRLMLIKIRIELDALVAAGVVDEADAVELAPKVAWLCYEAARASVEAARPVLEAIADAGIPMVLVSNFYGNIEAVLKDFDLLHFFPRIIESAVVGVRKPDPAIFALGVEALGLPAEQVLVVGDSLRKDIMPARSLGCQTAWVKGRGWTPDEDAATDPAQLPQGLLSLKEILNL